MRNINVIIVIICAGILLSGCSTSIEITSKWKVHPIVIALKPNDENLYGISVINDSSNIGIGFETTEINREELREKVMSSNMSGMDKGKLKEKMTQGVRGSRGSGMQRSLPEPLKYWIYVQLAPGN